MIKFPINSRVFHVPTRRKGTVTACMTCGPIVPNSIPVTFDDAKKIELINQDEFKKVVKT